MKMILVSLVFLMMTMISCQSSEEKIHVPDAVKAKMSAMYPKADHLKWELEDGNYEASFKENNLETSVIMSADGTIIETENEIDPAQLPQPIHDYVSSQLGGKKISEATKVVNATGQVSYEAEVGEIDYLFDASGQFTKSETEEGKDEDKD